ncbi:MAG: L-threonine 3-dehydrogenase [Deltaproteobacteria bacterium]|nr:L-threonine 3-dehydrogenase [Deltaproteobacteria bacterium]
MRAIVKVERGPGLVMKDVPVPELGPNDLRIRVRRSSICGTDVHIFDYDAWAEKTIPVPLVLGHEFMGEVESIGSAVTGFRVGERVSAEGHLTCGHCRNCRAGKRHLCRNTIGVGIHRDGGFAELVVVPAGNVFHVPDEIPDDVASILDPLGNAVHTALSFDVVGEDVLITGGGPIGIMAAAISRFVGARHVVVTDVNEHRLAIARDMGATRAVDIRATTLRETMHELGMTEGFDVGMEMSGHPDAITGMLDVMNHGGRVAALGIPRQNVTLDWNVIVFKGLVLKGIYGREMFETWYKMAALLRSGLDVKPVITHRFAASEHAEAFAAMRTGKAAKVVLDWTT